MLSDASFYTGAMVWNLGHKAKSNKYLLVGAGGVLRHCNALDGRYFMAPCNVGSNWIWLLAHCSKSYVRNLHFNGFLLVQYLHNAGFGIELHRHSSDLLSYVNRLILTSHFSVCVCGERRQSHIWKLKMYWLFSIELNNVRCSSETKLWH